MNAEVSRAVGRVFAVLQPPPDVRQRLREAAEKVGSLADLPTWARTYVAAAGLRVVPGTYTEAKPLVVGNERFVGGDVVTEEQVARMSERQRWRLLND